MAPTRNPSNPVTASEKTATMTAVRFRFMIRGCSSSGAICDSVSTPPMTNITEPRARMALNGDAGVPGVNGSGAIVPPWRARVMSAQTIANTSTEQAPMTAREMARVENIRPRRCPSHTTASSPTATATAVFSAAAGDICGARPARNSPSRTARPQRRRGIPGAAAPPAGPTPPPAREIRPVPASPGRTCRHGRTARTLRRRRPGPRRQSGPRPARTRAPRRRWLLPEIPAAKKATHPSSASASAAARHDGVKASRARVARTTRMRSAGMRPNELFPGSMGKASAVC